MFVLDSSGSIEADNEGNWIHILQFIINIVTRLSIGPDAVRVGVVSYSGLSKVNFLLDAYTSTRNLVDAFHKIPYIGDATNTAAAIEDMRTKVFTQKGDRSKVPNLAFLITDGASNINPGKTIPYANRARGDGIIMLAVGITDFINVTELIGISGNGVEGDTYWLLRGFGDSTEIENIVKRTCLLIRP